MFLSETKAKRNRVQFIQQELGFRSVFSTDAVGRSGGLALLWSDEVNVTLLNYSVAHIDVRVDMTNGQSWRFTGFYGNPAKECRHHSWTLLRRLAQQSTLPWLVMGDFNEILYQSEKFGMADRPYAQMAAFRDVLSDCDLVDLGFNGPQFTWTNGRDNGLVRERLDRAVATREWFDMFSRHRVFHLSSSFSDHLPVWVTDGSPDANKKSRWGAIPRFDPYWLQDEECVDIFAKEWAVGHALQSAGDLEVHVNKVRDGLRTWSKCKHGNLRKKIDSLEKQLEALRLLPNYSAEEERSILRRLDSAISMDEDFWKQRGRVDWLRFMDKNTTFFHYKASARREHNRIKSLLREDGTSADRLQDLQDTAAEYFDKIYTSSSVATGFLDGLSFRQLTQLQRERLVVRFEEAEIRIALSQLPGRKAPGPDGMQVVFLQKFWHVVGHDVTRVILSCLNDGADMAELNETFITLIPKCKAPSMMTDYRPISLCNSLYKLMSRTILNRLKPVMGDIISPQQSAFVCGRLITDNSIAALEAFHSLKTGQAGCDKHVAIKLDMAKAFDRVEWGYMTEVLRAMDFPESFITLISRCISSVTFQVLLNGCPSRAIYPSRGLRQGDPLSPFLFIICAEGLTALLNRAAHNQTLHGIRFGSAGPQLTHLLFADDSLLFMEATPESCSVVSSLLQDYEVVSGQQVNLSKSSLYFSKGVSDPCREVIVSEMGIPAGDGKGKYLGLPYMTGRSKKEIFNFVRERISKKISGWMERFLSAAGKEVLMKSVLQAIPTYVMQCFQLPKTLIRDIEVQLRKFFWGSSEGRSKVHWRAWEVCCSSKRDGGLGFRDMECFNTALLAKQAWRILSNPRSLSADILRAKYYANLDLLDARVGSRPSFLWRSFLVGRDLLAAGLRWRVGVGSSISIYNDPWLPLPPTFRPIFALHSLPSDAVVSDLILPGVKTWNENLLRDHFYSFEAERIREIPLPSGASSDNLMWHHDRKGKYTVKSGYQLALCQKLDHSQVAGPSSSCSVRTQLWRLIWSSPIHPRVRNFLWRLAQDCLPLGSNLAKRKIGDQICCLCGTETENSRHCFLECSIPRRVYAYSDEASRWSRTQAMSMPELLVGVFVAEGVESFGLFVYYLWHIWKARCKSIFEHSPVHIPSLCTMARQQFEDYNQASNLVEGKGIPPTWPVSWSKPPLGHIKINADAAVHADSSAVGVLFRDSEGAIVFAATKPVGQQKNVELVELLALKFGLEMAFDQGFSHVVLEGDSLLAYQRLISVEQDYSSLGSVADEIHRLARCFYFVKHSYVKRSGNVPAHLLARLGAASSSITIWDHDYPSDVTYATLADIAL